LLGEEIWIDSVGFLVEEIYFDFDFDSSNGAARDPDCWKVAIGISVSTEETSSSFLQASSSSSPLHAQLLLLLPVFFLLVL
jgi:hypothetical protein